MKWLRRLSLALLLPALAVALAGTLIGYAFGRGWAERQLQQMLQQSLGQPVGLELATVGLEHSVIRNVRIGNAQTMALPQLTLDYTLRELLQGRLQQLMIEAMTIDVQQTPQGWQVNGLTLPTSAPAAASYPAQAELVAAIPLGLAQIKQAQLQLHGSGWELGSPLALTWQREPIATLNLNSQAMQLKFGALTASAEKFSLAMPYDRDAQSWQGSWHIANIVLTGLPLSVPMLQGQGELRLKPDMLTMQGSLNSADQQWQLQGQFSLPAGGKPQLILQHLQFPAFGGTVKMAKTAIALDGKSPLQLAPELLHIDLPSLLQQLTGKAATGKGAISGTLPLTLLPGGKLRFGQAQLQADGPGIISLPPELIPGDNPQLVLLRDILRDLHYEDLALGLTSGDDGKLQLHFALNGNNPAVQQGKPVKLNIRLGGDVLNLLEQNLRILTNPQQLLPP